MVTKTQISDDRASMNNVVILGVGMSLCLIGVKVSSSFIVPILGSIGSVSMAILYFSNSFSNFFVPPILNLFKNERQAMFFVSFEYFLYTLAYSYIVPAYTLTASFIHGIVAAVLFTGESIVLSANSSDKDRGKKSGIFWTLYMAGATLGNIAVYILLNYIGLPDYPNPNGWHGSASIMFIFLAFLSLLGTIPLYFLKPSPNETNRKFVQKTSPKVLIKKMAKLIVDRDMRWLLLCFFFVGYEYVIIGSMLTRNVRDVKQVGLYMSLFSFLSMIVSTPLGLFQDKIGSLAMMSISTALELLAMLSFWFSNKYQGGLFFITFSLLSLSDSCYETLMPTVVGRNFSDSESANSVFRLFQYGGSCICYLIAPLFRDLPNKYVSDKMVFRELMLCVVFCIGCFISFVIYNHIHKEIRVVEKKDVKDEKSLELQNVANEDLDELSREAAEGDNKAKNDGSTMIDIKNFKSNEDVCH